MLGAIEVVLSYNSREKLVQLRSTPMKLGRMPLKLGSVPLNLGRGLVGPWSFAGKLSPTPLMLS